MLLLFMAAHSRAEIFLKNTVIKISVKLCNYYIRPMINIVVITGKKIEIPSIYW